MSRPSQNTVSNSGSGEKYSSDSGAAQKTMEKPSIHCWLSVTTNTVEIGEVTSCIASQGVRARANSPAMSHCGPNTRVNIHGATR